MDSLLFSLLIVCLACHTNIPCVPIHALVVEVPEPPVRTHCASLVHHLAFCSQPISMNDTHSIISRIYIVKLRTIIEPRHQSLPGFPCLSPSLKCFHNDDYPRFSPSDTRMDTPTSTIIIYLNSVDAGMRSFLYGCGRWKCKSNFLHTLHFTVLNQG